VKDLLRLTAEDLREKLDELMPNIKADHDMAVRLGSASVSPRSMSLYQDSIDKIRSVSSRSN
jgi:hypothetical protein